MDEDILTETFVELADTLAADFDIVEFLSVLTGRSAQLLDAAAGVVLADRRGQLRVAAASTETVRVLEFMQVEQAEGPGVDCFRASRLVTVPDVAAAGAMWPRFAPAAANAGFRTAQAFPMRLREQVIGVLDLFRARPVPFSRTELRVGQGLAHAATIGLLHERNLRRSEAQCDQLQGALNSRVVIEQAKGILAERFGVDMDAAFGLLRDESRYRNMRLSCLAQAFIDSRPAVPGRGLAPASPARRQA